MFSPTQCNRVDFSVCLFSKVVRYLTDRFSTTIAGGLDPDGKVSLLPKKHHKPQEERPDDKVLQQADRSYPEFVPRTESAPTNKQRAYWV